MRRLAGLALALALVAVGWPAHAETPPFDAGCRSVFPLISASLPANVPGLPFAGSFAAELADVALTSGDGVKVATALVDVDTGAATVVLALSSSLTPDTTYTLRWSDGCAVGKTRVFTTTAAAPFPTAAGTISVTEHRPPTADASCYMGRPTWPAQRNVIFNEDPALIAFLSIAKVDLLVNDKVDSYNIKTFGQYTDASLYAGLLHQSCPATVSPLRVALRVRLANGPTFTTPEIKTELQCLDTLPGGCPPSDAAVPPDDVFVGDTSIDLTDTTVIDSTDTGADAVDEAAEDASPKGAGADDIVVGGCTCSAPHSASSRGGVELLLTAAVLARLRAHRRAR